MNWEKEIELIWKYLDGTCSPSEKDEFDSKRAQNPEFNSLYEESLVIHNGMLNLTSIEAPVNLIQDTLSTLANQKSYSYLPKPFYIFISSLILLGLSSLLLPQSGNAPANLLPWINEIHLPSFSYTSEISRMLMYILPVFIAIPLFYVLDQNLARKLNVAGLA